MRWSANALKAKYNSGEQLSLGVVVPCHNNSRQLYGVLSALMYQSTRPETVVVVDDNSNPVEEQKLRWLCKNLAACYLKLPTPRTELESLGRRSHARNAGTKCLNTDLVLYLDGDMLLGPRYVEEIKYYHAALQGIYIRGQRHCIPATLQAKGMKVCLSEAAKRRLPTVALPPGYIVQPTNCGWKKAFDAACYDKWEWCASNNLSVRNEYVSQIGYWDENFVGWGEEDMDFSFRLHKSGLTPILLISDNAVSYHLEHHIDHKMNASTLRANARYLLSKFPEVAENRRDAYARYGVSIEDF
jgi:GT2 family glycosyltransferase